MAQRPQDKYANMASATVDVNGTITFTELLTGISLGQGMGILIDQIDYTPSIAALADIDADSDAIQYGWCTSNAVTTLANSQKQVIHAGFLAGVAHGTAGNMNLIDIPLTRQFFPPLIVAAPRLFLASLGAGTVTEGSVESRIYYRYISLSSQEYLEIAESFVLVG